MDDAYPNDGQAFDEPELTEQEVAIREEKAKVQQSAPVLDELIDKLEKDYADSNKLDNLQLGTGVSELESRILLQGHTKFQALLSTEINKLKSWRDDYVSKQGSLQAVYKTPLSYTAWSLSNSALRRRNLR